MDRVVAFLLLVCLSPLLLILLLITAIDLRCNPIFIQRRTVSNELEFDCYKIRSMYNTAPTIPTGEFSEAKLYITRWGNFMRMYSLDELLNLVSIVKGDMIFIGPRPIMPCEHDLLNLRQKNRICGRAGLTGLAQINGRDLISLKRKVACERYYQFRNKSIKLRFFILLRTLEIVIKKTGVTH